MEEIARRIPTVVLVGEPALGSILGAVEVVTQVEPAVVFRRVHARVYTQAVVEVPS
jgi:hypothetical protein